MVEWEPALPSVLFRNAGGGGPWVAVDVSALGAAATGARVEAAVGGTVLGTAWAASTTGYAAGAPPVVHLGLGGDAARARRRPTSRSSSPPSPARRLTLTVPSDSRARSAPVDRRHVAAPGGLSPQRVALLSSSTAEDTIVPPRGTT